MKVYIIWLIGVITWNFGVPDAAPIEDVLVATMNDRFIIRRYSPVITIGGGIILDAHINGKWSDKKK